MKRFSIPVLLVSALVGCTSNASSQPGSSSATPPNASGASRVSESGGTTLIRGAPAAQTHGYSPTLSPDGTLTAFLLDPEDPHVKSGNPYVLQVWLEHSDGSGLGKLGQERGCCIAVFPHLRWSQDGSTVVVFSTHKRMFDVPTGESVPMPSATG